MHTKIKLWENGTPLYQPEYGQEEPHLVDYTLKNGKSDNPCMIVIPGGAYATVCDEHEGSKICKMLNENGFSAFILEYRVAPYHHPVMEYDVKRAIRLVRFKAKEFGIAENKIAIMGFSAGGHLCCMGALRFDYGVNDGDEIDKVSSRPDLAVPCYAVTSFDEEIAHGGTRLNFLGEENLDRWEEFSSEKIVPDDAPPFFIWATAQDQAVPPECSLRLASALIKKNIPCELHIFPYGLHGIGLGYEIPLSSQWSDLMVEWLDYHWDI